MSKRRQLCFRINSNISAYKIIFYNDCDKICFNVKRFNQSIVLNTDVYKLSVVAFPREQGYTEPLYCKINLSCGNTVDLYLNFEESSPVVNVNNFYLTDKNYGLPINGYLIFNQIS